MFSKASRVPAHLVLVFTDDNFKWLEDEAVLRQRQRKRARGGLATCIAIALTTLILGKSFGVAWLLAAATEVSHAFEVTHAPKF